MKSGYLPMQCQVIFFFFHYYLFIRMALINFLNGSKYRSAVLNLPNSTHGLGWHSVHFVTLGPRGPGGPCKLKTKRKHILILFLKNNKKLKLEGRVKKINFHCMFLVTTSLCNITYMNCLYFVSYWKSVNARSP